jgi:hypothetical protein
MISVIVTLVILGLLLWVVDQLPIDGTIKRIIHVVVIVAAVLFVLQALGLWGGLPALRRIR